MVDDGDDEEINEEEEMINRIKNEKILTKSSYDEEKNEFITNRSLPKDSRINSIIVDDDNKDDYGDFDDDSYGNFDYGDDVGYKNEIFMPLFDGKQSDFSTNRSLPKENYISQIVVDDDIDDDDDDGYEEEEDKNENKFFISEDIKFIELSKTNGICISNNGKLITNRENYYGNCYLDLKIENGIYYIKYKYYKNGRIYDQILLGLSTDNTYSGNDIYSELTTCNYYGKSQDITRYCHIGTVVNENPYFYDCEDGSIYEIIVDMNKREYSISHNNSSPVILVKDLPSPLYPYVILGYRNTSVIIIILPL